MANLTKQWRRLLVLGSAVAALWLSFSLSNRLATAQRLAEAKRYLEAKDYAKALPLLQKAAAAGDAGAMKQLGDVYRGGGHTARNVVWASRDGRGLVQDYAQALAWYQKAAEAGNGVAKYQLSQQGSK